MTNIAYEYKHFIDFSTLLVNHKLCIVLADLTAIYGNHNGSSVLPFTVHKLYLQEHPDSGINVIYDPASHGICSEDKG
jgi:hypothetical protein